MRTIFLTHAPIPGSEDAYLLWPEEVSWKEYYDICKQQVSCPIEGWCNGVFGMKEAFRSGAVESGDLFCVANRLKHELLGNEHVLSQSSSLVYISSLFTIEACVRQEAERSQRNRET